MLVIYQNCEEQFIISLEKETQFLEYYFQPEFGRDLEEFDRSTVGSGMIKVVTNAPRIDPID